MTDRIRDSPRPAASSYRRERRTYRSPLRQRQAAGTRGLIIDALGEELARGGSGELSFGAVARRAGVAERTVYRHFPTREALIDALCTRVNETVLDLPEPLTAQNLAAGIAASFQSFDEHEVMMRGFLATAGGREVRAHARARRLRRIGAALRPVLQNAEPETARAVTAIVGQCSTGAWAALRDKAGLTGEQAGAAVAWAIETLLQTATPESEKKT